MSDRYTHFGQDLSANTLIYVVSECAIYVVYEKPEENKIFTDNAKAGHYIAFLIDNRKKGIFPACMYIKFRVIE